MCAVCDLYCVLDGNCQQPAVYFPLALSHRTFCVYIQSIDAVFYIGQVKSSFEFLTSDDGWVRGVAFMTERVQVRVGQRTKRTLLRVLMVIYVMRSINFCFLFRQFIFMLFTVLTFDYCSCVRSGIVCFFLYAFVLLRCSIIVHSCRIRPKTVFNSFVGQSIWAERCDQTNGQTSFCCLFVWFFCIVSSTGSRSWLGDNQ